MTDRERFLPASKAPAQQTILPRIGQGRAVSQPALAPFEPPAPRTWWDVLWCVDPAAKRSKAERIHEGRGLYRGVAIGMCMGVVVGLVAMYLGFTASSDVTANLAGQLDATRVARDAALGGR